MILMQSQGALARVTLARPPVNAIDEGWISQLQGIVETADRDASLGAVLVCSDQKAFSAGADLALMRSRFGSDEGRRKMVEFVRRMQHVYAMIERSPKIWIASIRGPAMGGGLELALACDLRIAADTAKLGLPEARLGLLPGAGGTQRLPLLCGPAVAKRMILGAEVLDGTEAARLGVVHWVVPSAELDSKTSELARRISALPSASLAACKRCIAAAGRPDHDGYGMELAATEDLLANEATQALVRAFLEGKR